MKYLVKTPTRKKHGRNSLIKINFGSPEGNTGGRNNLENTMIKITNNVKNGEYVNVNRINISIFKKEDLSNISTNLNIDCHKRSFD